jgi:hypothetical protein
MVFTGSLRRSLWRVGLTKFDVAELNQAMSAKSLDPNDPDWNKRYRHLALNTLLFMSSHPEDARLLEQLRRPVVQGGPPRMEYWPDPRILFDEVG